MRVLESPSHSSDDLRLLPDAYGRRDARRTGIAAAGSLLGHALGVLAVFYLPGLLPPSPRDGPRIEADLRKSITLVAPSEITRKDLTPETARQELDLEDLLSPARGKLTAPRPVTLPAVEPRAPEAPLVLPAPPQIEAQPQQQLAATPPIIRTEPRILAEEKPRIAFESPGAASARQDAARSPLPPGSAIQQAMRDAATGQLTGGLVVGDVGEGIGGFGEIAGLPPSPARSASSLQMLSDPMGVDFRPYLVQVLAAVRRNWFAVIPESARLGRRGRVNILFAINKDGRVPKLVIATPSGTDAFDRAAVAGISASNPFPPLPSSYGGDQIRLQLTFLYNVRRAPPGAQVP